MNNEKICLKWTLKQITTKDINHVLKRLDIKHARKLLDYALQLELKQRTNRKETK